MGTKRQCSVLVSLGLNIDMSIYFDKNTPFEIVNNRKNRIFDSIGFLSLSCDPFQDF